MDRLDVSGWIFSRRKLLVRLCLLPLLVLFVFERPFSVAKELWVVSLSLVFVAGGISLRLWATRHIGGRKTQELITSGPYAYTRNPLYLGSLLGVIGVLALSQAVIAALVCLIFISLIFFATICYEERVLEERFGEGFRAYCMQVPRILPRLSRAVVAKGVELSPIEPVFLRRERGNALAFLLSCGVVMGLRLLVDWLQLKVGWLGLLSLESVLTALS